MKQLFIVESPLQLLNAYEAIYHFKSENQELLIRYSGDFYNDKQINDTVNKLDIPKNVIIKTTTILAENKKFMDLIKILRWKLFGLLYSSQYSSIFIGNFESKFMKQVIGSNTNLILLDDGFKTINTQKSFTPNHFFDWFTLFKLQPIKNQKIYKNNYTNLNKHVSEIAPNNNQVLFIGSKLSEVDIISEKYYNALISKIAQRYSSKEFIYIPHRGENLKKLKQLERIPNLTIKWLQFPIELLSIYSTISPSIIASFYSTALITLSKIYKANTIAFKFDYSASPYKNDIQNVYDYCEDYMEVINEIDI